MAKSGVPVADDLPTPVTAQNWDDFTARLRELYDACGRPKYETLARSSGLAKSAISGLIGVNPLRRPTEATLSRFVSGCVRHVNLPSDEASTYCDHWLIAWSRLEQIDLERQSEDGTSVALQPPHWVEARPRTLSWWLPTAQYRAAILVAFLVMVLLAALNRWVGGGSSEVSEQTRPSGTSGASTGVNCVPAVGDRVDHRLNLTWSTAFVCANDASPVYEFPAPKGPPIGRLRSTKSWFVCWAHGVRTANGSDVWYYTQGDDDLVKHDLEAWGFVPSTIVDSAIQPAPGANPQCPFPSDPTSQRGIVGTGRSGPPLR